MRRRKYIAKKTAEWTSLELHSREKEKAPFLLIAIGNARIPKNKPVSQHAYTLRKRRSFDILTLLLGISFRNAESATYSDR